MKVRFTPRIALKHLAMLLAISLPNVVQAQQSERKYPLGPDSMLHADVPAGTLTEHQLLESNSYPGTIRRYYVYVPTQYQKDKPASLLVFQDGHTYVDGQGDWRIPTVLDNLIHRGEIPVTIAVFVDPGHKKQQLPDKPGWNPAPENRSLEYDTLSNTYATFLESEILPLVEKDYAISADPAQRAICGISSGGICMVACKLLRIVCSAARSGTSRYEARNAGAMHFDMLAAK